MACYSQTGLLQSLDILYKIQYTRVEGDVYAIALHETSLLSVYLLVRGLYFYLHTRFSCHRLPKLYANFSHSDLKLVAAAPQTAATVIYYNGFGLESQMEVFDWS